MSEILYINRSISAIEKSISAFTLLSRRGRPFLAIPQDRVAAGRALSLYKPQKHMAVLAIMTVRFLVMLGLHRFLLAKHSATLHTVTLDPTLARCIPGTLGVMLGSPEHHVRRAIASYRTLERWEVAKLAFGKEGKVVIEGEFSALRSMPVGTPGIPSPLGVHHGDDLSLLRLPYLSGRPLATFESARAIELLNSWVRPLPLRLISDFPEWASICSALETSESGRAAIKRMAKLKLRPVIRHGDFARWNLLKIKEGDLIAIDWEWGCAEGMPGVDLVHFFAQDARLVEQLPPERIVQKVCNLVSHHSCLTYLQKTGWNGRILDVIIASIAFTLGSNQQANSQVLEAALSLQNE